MRTSTTRTFNIRPIIVCSMGAFSEAGPYPKPMPVPRFWFQRALFPVQVFWFRFHSCFLWQTQFDRIWIHIYIYFFWFGYSTVRNHWKLGRGPVICKMQGWHSWWRKRDCWIYHCICHQKTRNAEGTRVTPFFLNVRVIICFFEKSISQLSCNEVNYKQRPEMARVSLSDTLFTAQHVKIYVPQVIFGS